MNKKMLKKIILEVMTETEPQAKMTTAQQTGASHQQKKAMIKGGISDQERAAINMLSQKLAAAAKKGNILSGTLKHRLEILIAEIEKFLGDTPEQPTQQNQVQGVQ